MEPGSVKCGIDCVWDVDVGLSGGANFNRPHFKRKKKPKRRRSTDKAVRFWISAKRMKQLCGRVEVRLLTATFTVPKAPVPPLSSEIEGAPLGWIGGAKPTVS